LLSVAGKILARFMLKRLLSQVVDIVLPESQCGFRRERSNIDMIFVARLLQEKCREQSRDLYLAFIDLTKSFETVNRELLWQILRRFNCPPAFLTILQEFHNGMKAKVTVGGRESDQLPLHWLVVMVFPPLLEFHIPTVWMAVSLACVD